ncbi:MAG: glucose-1-phosphate adenylyltransferase [Verrucomicrobia bacterium]|nr:glucose-1-phosphate adenylyltransferase [Verrucomicrobiota bacterium]MDA1065172.1 glucose-1-phosphate adenylyltransferase [Verrucomicrobiota bacterium]
MTPKVLAVIMGGGRGSRLYPLTKERCKPAVPLAGKYRLVDIPISNCLNSGLNRVYLLTQFNTASLHRHIQYSYKFDPFGGGFVDILAAEQTEKGENWYQGTADAVRQNMHHFSDFDFDYLLILSGDQLYRMDFNELIEQHIANGSEVTIAAKALPISQVEGLGLMRVKDDLSISEFVEKPKDPAVIEGLAISETLQAKVKNSREEKHCLASMGIYLFNRDLLIKSLENDMRDFGKEIIPGLLGKSKLSSFIFDGYWEDIGTVASFFEANLSLTSDLPPFNFFESDYPVYTRARYLPAAKINKCRIDHAIIADGCIIYEAELIQCVIGVRSIIREGCKLERVIMMGAEYFEPPEVVEELRGKGIPAIGVGRNCTIKNAIIDKGARIGDNVTLTPDGKADKTEGEGYFVRDGVIVILKGAIIPDGAII